MTILNHNHHAIQHMPSGRHRGFVAALMATTALSLCALPLAAEEFVVDGISNVQNGGNVLDGGDSLTITPTGQIIAAGSGAVYGTNGNQIINDGFIGASGVARHGIFLFDGLNTVLNNGTVLTSGDLSNSIYVIGTGSVVQNNNIVVANGLGSNGILLGGDGRVLNAASGEIITNGQATGIFAVENVTVVNAGLIRTFGDLSTGIIHQTGISRIFNEGRIETDGFDSYGIAVDADSAIIENSGTIITNGDDSSGIFVVGPDSVAFNTGVILTQGAGSSHALHLSGGGSIINSGTITTQGPDSWGIIAEGGGVYDIENSGLIEAGGRGGILTTEERAHILNSGAITLGSASGTAILSQQFGSRLTNTGVIQSSVPGGVGMFSSGQNSILRNSGQIFMAGGTAIELGVGFQFVILDAGSITVGDLVVVGGGANFDIRLPNAALTFDGSPAIYETGDRPSLLDGDTLHVFDPAHFAALDRASVGALDGVDMALSQPRRGDRFEAWATGFFGGNGTDSRGGVVVGGTWHLAPDNRLDAFVGTLSSAYETAFSSSEIDTWGAFAGIGYGGESGRWFYQASAVLGQADHDSIRRVADNTVATGISEAEAATTSSFVGLAMTVGTQMEWGETTLRPSMRLRSLTQETEGFAESGSNSALDVASRNSRRLDLRAKIEADLPIRDTAFGDIDLTVFAGLDAVRLDSDAVMAEVVGQQISFAASDDDLAIGSFIGASATLAAGNGGVLSFQAELGSGTGEGMAARIGANYVYRF